MTLVVSSRGNFRLGSRRNGSGDFERTTGLSVATKATGEQTTFDPRRKNTGKVERDGSTSVPF